MIYSELVLNHPYHFNVDISRDIVYSTISVEDLLSADDLDLFKIKLIGNATVLLQKDMNSDSRFLLSSKDYNTDVSYTKLLLPKECVPHLYTLADITCVVRITLDAGVVNMGMVSTDPNSRPFLVSYDPFLLDELDGYSLESMDEPKDMLCIEGYISPQNSVSLSCSLDMETEILS